MFAGQLEMSPMFSPIFSPWNTSFALLMKGFDGIKIDQDETPKYDIETRKVEVVVGQVKLKASISIPGDVRGVVVFANTSSSVHTNMRDEFLAKMLNESGFATVLGDLLTTSEMLNSEFACDIDLLTDRMVALTGWVHEHPRLKLLSIGYFGAGTGAAAALSAAAQLGDRVSVVVSRGGHPDLVKSDVLAQVHASTLFIVGGADSESVGMNEWAYQQLQCPRRLEVIPRAGSMFSEAGALDQVMEFAREWFIENIGGSSKTFRDRSGFDTHETSSFLN